MAAKSRRAWTIAAVALPLYSFLYDNATSMPLAMGHAWTRLTPLSRQVRLLEIAVVCILLVAALLHRVSRVTRNLLTAALLFIALGLMSFLHSASVSLLDGSRLIYLWVLPAFIFIIGRDAPWPQGAWRITATAILGWVLLSMTVSWVQCFVLGYPVGDDITGLNKDAHANGTLLMLTALQLLAFALYYERRLPLVLALMMLLTMVLSSVLKTMFLGVAAVGLLVFLYLRWGPRPLAGIAPRAVKWGMGLSFTVVVIGVAFTQVDVLSSDRMGDLGEKVRKDPQSLGPFRAHQAALGKIARDLPTLALGLGPFRFANPISVGQNLEEGGSRLANAASGELLAIADEKGEETRITLTSSLLGEFGIPAFLAAIVMYVTIIRTVWRTTYHRQLDIRTRGAGLIACWTIVGLTPIASLFGSFDVISVSWPLLLLSGMLCSEAANSSS
jgi:hypothetical protein